MSALSVSLIKPRPLAWVAILAAISAIDGGCYKQPESVLQRLTETQGIAGRLQVEFTRASDATNLAVMAQSDEASAKFAQEAARRMEAVQHQAEALRPLLASLKFSQEGQLLDQFNRQFATCRTLDQKILRLAVANDNLKAQRLSFGPAQKAADDFRLALEQVRRSAAGDSSRLDALAFKALAALRQIQVLEAPHIAESRDEVMTSLEKQMAAAEAETRGALDGLAALLPTDEKAKVNAAEVALTHFLDYHRQILALSRSNSNVRSLALALGQRRRLTAECSDTLEALTQALQKRGFRATR